MKYLIINGSPHKGITWRFAELVKYELQALCDSADFDEIHLTDLNLPFCSGCSLCFRKGHIYCPHNSIMTKLINAIDNSDGVYWTEPKRANNVYDNNIPLPFYKKIFGTVFYMIGKSAGKFVTITYRK